MAFGWVDYLVLLIMLIVSSGIGIYYSLTGGKQKTTKEFLLANNDANLYTVAFSLMATFMSSITLLGVSSEVYTFGIQFVVINFSYVIFTPLAVYFYLPVFFKLKTTSAYEYLERRFGIATRLVASLAFTFQMVLYMGLVVYAPALALEAVTAINRDWAVLILGVVCTFYAVMGGMKAVLVTDVFQSLLMFAAVFCVIGTAVSVTGFSGVWKIAGDHQRLEFWNFNPDPTIRHTWWSLIIGGGLTFMSLYAVNQAQVQRYMSCKNLKSAQKSLYLNLPILSMLSFCTSFAGLCIFSKYYDCDPVLAERISSAEQLMPRYVLDTMGDYPGLSGLFVAGIFSGSLSTVSSAINSLAAVTVEDYLKPAVKRIRGHGLDEDKLAIWSKLLCLAYGCFCLTIAFVARYMGAVLQASLTVFGVVGGPVLGTFTLGMFFPIANEVGALGGILFGLTLALWIGFGGPKPPLPHLPMWSSEEACSKYDDIHLTVFRNASTPSREIDTLFLYKLSYQWNIVLSFLLTVTAGLAISWISFKLKLGHSQPSHPDLFSPPVARYLEKKRQKIDNLETQGRL